MPVRGNAVSVQHGDCACQPSFSSPWEPVWATRVLLTAVSLQQQVFGRTVRRQTKNQQYNHKCPCPSDNRTLCGYWKRIQAICKLVY